MSSRPFRQLPTTLTVALLTAVAGCNPQTFFNQTASFGGDVAGTTGNVEVSFINNTPHRAIFTYGTYNNTDQFSQPVAQQFSGSGTTLEGEAVASIVSLPCDRVFSIGDSELLRLLAENGPTGQDLDPEALVQGVAFSSAALGEEDAGIATEGFAPAVRALLGVDFPCGSILIIRFEEDDIGEAPFRADFEVIPPADPNDRGT